MNKTKEYYLASDSRFVQSLFRKAVLVANVTRIMVMAVARKGLRDVAGLQRA